jgi:hypothetical protein
MTDMTNKNDFNVAMVYFMELSIHLFEGAEEQ